MMKLSEVKDGDTIKINVSGFVVSAVCLKNSPAEMKMYLRMFFSSGNTSESVEKYSDHTFINFNILNGSELKNNDLLKNDLSDFLRKKIQSEKYEEAAILNEAIKKLEKLNFQ